MLESYNGFSGVATVPLGERLPVGLLPALVGHRTCRALFMSGIVHVGHCSCRALFMSGIAHVGHCTCRALHMSGIV